MTDQIKISNEIIEVKANLVPLHIQYSGAANTSDYFTPSKTNEDLHNASQVAYFRGCKLVGREIGLKENFIGYLVNKSECIVRSEHDNEQGMYENFEDEIRTVNIYTPTAKFQDITMFGQDEAPESNNQWNLINEWKEISEIIHS